MSNTARIMNSYIYNIAGGDPRYASFLKAQGITETKMEKQTLIDKLMDTHGIRIEAYKYYWEMYYGYHWFTVSDENLGKVKANITAYNTNKHVSFLMNKGFLVESDFPEIEKFLQKNWRLNKGGMDKINLFGWEWALQGAVSGDVWVEIVYANNEDENTNYYKYKILNSMGVFPVVDRGKYKGLLYYYPEDFLVAENNGFAEYDNKYAGYYITKGQKKFIEEENVTSVVPNSYLDLPFVHTKNMINPNDIYGVSDLSSIAELNTLYERLLTDVQDIVDYNAAPVTIISGAKAGDLIRGANKVWALPNGATINNLEMKGDLGAINNHIAKIREIIAEQGNVPETVGKLNNISNTSAVALAINFLPMFDVMELKRIIYGSSLLEINRKTLDMAFLKGDLKPGQIVKNAISKWEKDFANESDDTKEKFYPFDKKYSAEEIEKMDSIEAVVNKKIPFELYWTYVTWFPPLPRDEKGNSDLAIAMVNNKLWSKRYARAFTGQSEKESILMDKEISSETMSDMEMENMSQESMTLTDKPVTKMKTGMEGAPEVHGQMTSMMKEKNAGMQE